MIGRESKGPAVKRLVEFILPSNTRGLCRSKEKQIFLLALGTISFLCFGSIWFLPGSTGKPNKVEAVQQLIAEQAKNVENLILPPPPGDSGGDQNNINPNIRHGVLDKPERDHKKQEKAFLDAQIELDDEIKKIRQNQEHQVLAKPNNFDVKEGEKKPSSSLPQALDNEFAKPGKKPAEKIADSGASPLIQGGEDDDEVSRQRRNHVKGVSYPVQYNTPGVILRSEVCG